MNAQNGDLQQRARDLQTEIGTTAKTVAGLERDVTHLQNTMEKYYVTKEALEQTKYKLMMSWWGAALAVLIAIANIAVLAWRIVTLQGS